MAGATPPKRAKMIREDLQSLSKEELLQRLEEQCTYIEQMENKQIPGGENSEEINGLRESEQQLKQQQNEATRRENVLVMRLTTKEQEMQEFLNQIQELKQAQNPSTAQLRGMLLDPAINLMFQRMKKEMDSCKEKLEQAQNDLAAWKFTPDSQTGKRLMAKCRMLLQENEDLGKQISSGRTAKLEGEIALEKELVKEMKKSQAEMDEFLLELDEGSEGMQSTIILLQQELKEAKEKIAQLQHENTELQSSVANNARVSPTPMDTDTERTDSRVETSEDWGVPQQTQQTSEISENGHLDSQGEGMETDSSEPNRVETTGVLESYRTQADTNNSIDGNEPVDTDASSEPWSPKESKQSHLSNSTTDIVDESKSAEENMSTKKVLRTDSQEEAFQNGSVGSIGSPESMSQESET